MELLCSLISIFYFVVIGRIILSLVTTFGRLPWGHPVRRVEEALSVVVDPALRPIRAILPPLPAGGMSLDLSPLVLIVLLGVLQRAIC